MGKLLNGLLSLGAGLLMALVFIAVLVLLPLALIWCLNTLGIATASYSIVEWVAAALLTTFFLGGSGGNR